MHPDLAGALAHQHQQEKLKHLERQRDGAGRRGLADGRPGAASRFRKTIGLVLVSAGNRLIGPPAADNGAGQLPTGVVSILRESMLRERC